MTHGKRERTFPPACAWVVLSGALAAGCQHPSVQRVEPSPALPSPAGGQAGTTPTAEVPTLAPEPKSEVTAQAVASDPPAAAPEQETPPAPTPLLDSLAQRAEALKQVSVASLEEPEPPADPGPRPKTLTPKSPPRIIEAPGELELPPGDVSPELPAEPAKPPAPINADRPSEPPPRAVDVWGDGLESLRKYARDRTKDPDDLWALRAGVLDWIAQSQDDDPRAQLWRTVLTPLIRPEGSAITNEHINSKQIQEAVGALEASAPLEITDLRLCRKVNGFGNFEPLPAAATRAGRPLILYCEVSGLRYEPSGDSYRSRLAGHVEVVSTPDGKSVWTHALGTAEDVCHRRRRDYFVPYGSPSPLAPPGALQLRLTQTDLITDRSTALALPLTIHP